MWERTQLSPARWWRGWRVMVQSQIFAVVVQLLYGVQLFANPGTAAHQAPLSSSVSQSLFKFMSIELVMLFNHLILCLSLLLLPSIFPSIRVFSNELALHTGGQSIGASTSASVLPMNIQGCFPLGLTDLILQSKELSRVFSSTTIQKHQLLWHSAFLMVQLSPPYMTNRDMTTIALIIWTFVGKVMSLLFNMLSWFLIAFLPRSKHLLISWL